MASAVTSPRVGALTVLRTPGFSGPFLSVLLGRLPIGAVGLLLILHVRELTGSYAAGGVTAGAFAISEGIAAPLVGRLVDARGQGKVLPPCAAVGAAALVVIALFGDGTPLGTFVALAVVGGAGTPPLSACLRALWPSLLGGGDRLHAAYTLEAGAQEIVYISGPLLLVGAVGAVSTSLGLLACGALTAIGTLLFALQPASRGWRPDAEAQGHGLAGAMSEPGVRAMTLVFALLGLGLGAIELTTTAIARNEGHEGATAILLALWGAGSLVGGILWSRRGAPARPGRELARLFALLGVLQLPLLLADSLLLAGLLLPVAGFAIAPTMACAFRVVSDIARAGTVTEAFTWMSTGILAGVAAGSAISGVLVDELGLRWGFALAAAAGLAAAAAASRRVLRSVGEPEEDQFIEGSAGIRASSA